jgi:hypothetical protein
MNEKPFPGRTRPLKEGKNPYQRHEKHGYVGGCHQSSQPETVRVDDILRRRSAGLPQIFFLWLLDDRQIDCAITDWWRNFRLLVGGLLFSIEDTHCV